MPLEFLIHPSDCHLPTPFKTRYYICYSRHRNSARATVSNKAVLPLAYNMELFAQDSDYVGPVGHPFAGLGSLCRYASNLAAKLRTKSIPEKS
jgi:hypothetical protein